MSLYRFSGYGRRVGALGLSEPFTCEVEAQDETAARLAVYEQYEHIAGGAEGLRLLAPGQHLTIGEAVALQAANARPVDSEDGSR